MRKERCRILFVHHVSEIGGASFCLLNIIRALDLDYFEPIVLLRNVGPLSDELQRLGIPIKYLPSLTTYPYNKSLIDPRTLKSVIASYKSLRQFEKIVLAINPNIVYFNNSLLFPFLDITKKYDIKSVIHIREHWPLNQHKGQLNFIQKQINQKADHIIAINEYSGRMISKNLNKTTIIYDWIDMESRYDNLHIETILNEDISNLKIFLYTGGDNWIKGYHEVIKAFHEELKNPDYRLLALGVSNDVHLSGISGLIKRMLNKIGIKSADFKTCEVINKDKRIITHPAHYNISNIIKEAYCNISYFRIPHANLALAECIILGTPSIAADTEESKEYSLEGKLSKLYPINNYNAFLSQLNYFEKDYDIIKEQLMLRGIDIKMKFDKERNVMKLNQTLKQLSRI